MIAKRFESEVFFSHRCQSFRSRFFRLRLFGRLPRPVHTICTYFLFRNAGNPVQRHQRASRKPGIIAVDANLAIPARPSCRPMVEATRLVN